MAEQKPTPKIDWASIKSLAVDGCTLLVVYADGRTEKIRFDNKSEMLKVLENRQKSSN
jgi:hypothetical protein